MRQKDEYLADVAAHLPLVEPSRREILAELDDHIDDRIDELVAEGRTSETATQEVIRRLGSAQALARSIIKAKQTNRRLLAAAGGGTMAALSGAVRGAVVTIVAGVAVFAWMMLLRLTDAVTVERMFATSGVPMVLLMLSTVAYSMGRTAPFTVALISARSLSWARVAVASVGGAAVLFLFWFVYTTEMPPWSAPGFAALPFLFLIGVARATERKWLATDLDLRAHGAMVVAGIVLCVASLLLTPATVELEFHTDPDEASLAVVGDVARLGLVDFPRDSWWARTEPVVAADVTAESIGLAAIQLEVWPSTEDLKSIAAGGDGPIYVTQFRSGPYARDGWLGGEVMGMPFMLGAEYAVAYHATIDLSERRTWSPAWVVFVGITDDDRRIVLDYSIPGSRYLRFVGTFAEWLRAD